MISSMPLLFISAPFDQRKSRLVRGPEAVEAFGRGCFVAPGRGGRGVAL